MSKNLTRRFAISAQLIALGLATLSSNWESPQWILTEEDRALEATQKRRALGSSVHENPSWESFNEWRCFSTKDIELTYLEHIWDPETKPELKERSAAIGVSSNEGHLEFDYEDSHFTGQNPDLILSKWKGLIAGERTVCIYAAYLEELDETTSSWIITGLKTTRGYWPENLVRLTTSE
jgi:hypothetical protein